jgi:hypothetical protein
MITLDQVQKLERKVKDAVDLITRFKAEKVVLEEKIEDYELRIMELEEITEQLNKDQTEIEDKFIVALNQLEDLESDSEEAVVDEEILQNEETSVEGSVSEDKDIVETETLESNESVVNSEITVKTEEENYEEKIVDDEVESEATLYENKEDNQSELQESVTEDPQVGLPENEDDMEKEEVPTIESEFGETPEDKSNKANNPDSELFEQSLDIF